MEEMTYEKRLQLLRALCEAEANPDSSPNLDQYPPLEAANYVACYLTFKSIQLAGRSPADERVENFDMLSVYQTFAALLYAYLTLPYVREQEISPDMSEASLIIAKSLFVGLPDTELLEIVDSGMRKFELIAGAEQEHWTEYRQDLEKAAISYLVAATDDEAPFSREDVLPVLSRLLSMLCEAFTDV